MKKKKKKSNMVGMILEKTWEYKDLSCSLAREACVGVMQPVERKSP